MAPLRSGEDLIKVDDFLRVWEFRNFNSNATFFCLGNPHPPSSFLQIECMPANSMCICTCRLHVEVARSLHGGDTHGP